MKPTLTRRVAALIVAILAAPVAAQESHSVAQHEARRDEWQKVDAIFAAMNVKRGAVVADIGAGGGFFTTRLSRSVGPEGRVYAVEIASAELKRLRTRVENEKLSNVEVVEGATDNPKLPSASLDAALIVNAYHEMKQYREMLAALKAALKPGGRLVIVEPISASRRDASRDVQVQSHEIGAEFVRQETREAGFAHVQLHDPFTTRPHGHDEEWMLVVTPARPAADSSAQREMADERRQ
jgi:predicted methyltransferase